MSLALPTPVVRRIHADTQREYPELWRKTTGRAKYDLDNGGVTQPNSEVARVTLTTLGIRVQRPPAGGYGPTSHLSEALLLRGYGVVLD